MAIYNFVKAENNQKGERLILWHIGNYRYEIERKKGDMTVARSNYLNTSFEQITEIFERMVR